MEERRVAAIDAPRSTPSASCELLACTLRTQYSVCARVPSVALDERLDGLHSARRTRSAEASNRIMRDIAMDTVQLRRPLLRIWMCMWSDLALCKCGGSHARFVPFVA
jgi:hypothetical protein